MADKSNEERLKALNEEVRRLEMQAPWWGFGESQYQKPQVWRWADIYRCLMEAGEVMPVGTDFLTDRRSLILNTKSSTLMMAFQLLLPGESAQAHRHNFLSDPLRRPGERGIFHGGRRAASFNVSDKKRRLYGVGYPSVGYPSSDPWNHPIGARFEERTRSCRLVSFRSAALYSGFAADPDPPAGQRKEVSEVRGVRQV